MRSTLHRLFPSDHLMSTSGSGPRREFETVQALRGIAAAIVVVYHANWGLNAINPRHDPASKLFQGSAAGVDIFFVISGFVMVLSQGSRSGGLQDARRFIVNRIQRIVPMYWLLTTAAVLLHAYAPNYAMGSYFGLWHVVSSYLFIPAFDLPLIPAGWTLYLEMLFYALIALALLLRLPIVRSVSAALLTIALLHPLLGRWAVPANLSKDAIVEFTFGMLIARALLRGRVLSTRWTWPLIALGFVAIATGAHAHYLPRCVFWGLPALAIVGGAVSRESATPVRIPRWLLTLGNASYSLYLSHPVVIWILTGIVRHEHWHGPVVDALFFVLSLTLSSLVGLALYYAVERPIIKAFKRRRRHPQALALSPREHLPNAAGSSTQNSDRELHIASATSARDRV